MKHCLLAGTFLSLVTVIAQPAGAKPAHRRNALVQRVYVVPVRCRYKDCWEASTTDYAGHWKRSRHVGHGDVHIVYAGGRDVRLTTGGNCVGASLKLNGAVSNAPQVSPDRRTVGWTRGGHKHCDDWSIGGTMFVNSQLVLFRNGRVLHVLAVPGTFIEGWRFWNGGKYVAVGSRWHHGQGFCRLFDVASGKLLQRISDNQVENKHLTWARGLTA